MKFSSPVYSAVSGSIAGVTYARARGGGMYARARALPTNPNTARQQAVRANFGSSSQQWNLLTSAQREAWDLYASNTPVTDALGATSLCSGQMMWTRWSSVYMLENQTPPTNSGGPTIFNTGTPPVIEQSISSVGVIGGVAISNAVDAAAQTHISIGRPQNAGISFYKGPYRFYASLVQPIAIPTATVLAQVGYAYVAGQKLPVRLRNVHPDGRVSQDVQQLFTVQA